MRLRFICRLIAVTSLSAIAVSESVPANAPSRPTDEEIVLEQFKPRWMVGEQWIVKTAALQLQVADNQRTRSRGKPVRWHFTVRGIEKVGGHNCYQVQIRPLAAGRPQPVTTLWVDGQSLCLRQFQTQLPVRGGFRTVTESYQFADGQPSPVLCPLTAVPLDLPLFLGGQVKGPQKFIYQTTAGPAGKKAVGDTSFTFEVEQEFGRPKPEQVEGLLHNSFTKDLKPRQVIEIRLESFDRQIRQLWPLRSPWPAYTDDGTTVARLVKVIPASSQPNDPREVQP